ncbi:hypothetical protein [Nocardiopsis sp. MG754419]|nr:hypothetical protein [Nocardiopsis sp. MG754419]
METMDGTFTPFEPGDDARFRSGALIAILVFVTVTVTGAVLLLRL